MTTITINERTKAGKALLALASLLAKSDKDVVIQLGTTSENKSLTSKQKTLINRLKKAKEEVDKGAFKGVSVQDFLNEL